jgi:hypothetical protein
LRNILFAVKNTIHLLKIVIISIKILLQLLVRQLFLPRRVRVHRFDVALQELLPVRAVQAQVASIRHLQNNHRLLSFRQLAIIHGQTSADRTKPGLSL